VKQGTKHLTAASSTPAFSLALVKLGIPLSQTLASFVRESLFAFASSSLPY
jgi:hypothetical protein